MRPYKCTDLTIATAVGRAVPYPARTAVLADHCHSSANLEAEGVSRREGSTIPSAYILSINGTNPSTPSSLCQFGNITVFFRDLSRFFSSDPSSLIASPFFYKFMSELQHRTRSAAAVFQDHVQSGSIKWMYRISVSDEMS